jgi:CelD/BcsL family acetyltransferase involved in cellulose biosynthesis
MSTVTYRLDAPAGRDPVPAWPETVRVIPQSAPAPVVLEIVSDRAGFDALAADWNALVERAGLPTHVFQTFGWCWHWCNVFLPSPGTSLAVVTGRRAGRLVMVWPLVLRRTGMLKELCWLGEPVSQYGDIIVDAPGDPQALIVQGWTFIRRNLKPDLARLGKVRADAVIAPFLRTLGAVVSDEQEAPCLELARSGSIDAYAERNSAHERRNRRRLQRRLEERGPIAIERHEEGPQARDLVVLALAMKQQWLASRGLPSPAFNDPRMADFFAAVAAGGLHSTGLSAFVLTSNGEPASIQVGFTCKGRMAVHILVYALALEKTRAGVLHLEDTVRQAIAEGLEAIDLLAPRADYKMEWADSTTAVADYSVPLTAAGWLWARIYLGLVRERLKTGVMALPLPVRRRLTALIAKVKAARA